ncbi:MAG: Phage head morphosis protein [Caulobacter sp.]|nr:Phage head morphosis protein [Caulobacter sp.]
MAAVTLKPLPAQEAIDYFRGKGLAESFAWQDVWQEEHARAFTVAKAGTGDLLNDIRQAVDQGLADGTTFEQFKSGLQPLLETRGWWGKQKMVDPLTGEERLVQLGSPRRLRTIFDTNLRTAHAAGAWQRIQETKSALPYLLYHHTAQNHPRREHQAWASQPVCLPVDDPWWQVHYPPNGWGCKCFVTQLNKRMMDRRGVAETERPIKFPPKGYTNPRTGEVITVEQGIDPGWGYNVGEAYMRPITPKRRPGGPIGGEGGGGPGPGPGLPPLPSAGPAPELLPETVTQEAAEAAFLADFGATHAKAAVFTDAAGEPFVAGADLFTDAGGKPVNLTAADRRSLPLVSAAIRNPSEIRWGWPTRGGAQILARLYLARLQHAGTVVDVAVEVTAGSLADWFWVISRDDQVLIDQLRAGELAYSAAAAPSD